MSTVSIDAGTVHEVLRRHLLVDGLHLVVDLERSRGVRIRDASSGEEYLDFFGGFSTSALGFNHPAFADAEFLAELVPAVVNKITNSDLYTESLARFVATFASVLPETLRHHLFFIEGGALAVENTLKAAFDWKHKRNLAAGRAADRQSDPPLPRRVPRPQRLHAVAHQHRPGQDRALPQVPVAAGEQSGAALPDRRARARRRAPRRGAVARRDPPRVRGAIRTTSRRSSSSRSRPRAATTTSAPSSFARCVRSPTRASCCSSSTRCRPASAPPDAGGASSTSASSPT